MSTNRYKLWICSVCGDNAEVEPGGLCEVCSEGTIQIVEMVPVQTDADAQSRRARILFEIAARADLYEADVAPQTHGERFAGVIAIGDSLGWGTCARDALLELGGRVLAWLEADAKEQQR